MPSRNRQVYFQETIRALLSSPRDDVEIVAADNSDDPALMDAFMREVASDRRLRFLPSAEKPLSMLDNWDRTAAAATGRWIAFIGDDDYIDPDLAGLLLRLEARLPDVDAVAWNRLSFHWPGTRDNATTTAVPTDCRIVEIARDELLRKTFGWQDAGKVPTFMFSAYHAAARRDLMEANRARYGGRYFEHPNVDQESGFKIICNARRFVFSERPFSVLGACPASNSAAIGNTRENARRHAEFMADLGRNMDNDPYMANFPFLSAFGVTASVALSQHWFKTTYGLRFEGWEANFARSCAMDCEGAASREDFETMRGWYEAAFKSWKGGRFLSHFKPVYREPLKQQALFTGVTPLLVHVEEHMADASTPRDLYEAACGMMTPPDEVPISL